MAKKYKNIYRFDYDTKYTHAWYVAIRRRGKVFRKIFSDGAYGGKRKAFQKAKAYRDEIIKQYLPMTKKQFVSIKRNTNRSGVPGVCRFPCTNTMSDGTTVRYYVWAASWSTTEGKRKQKRFAIDEYGEEGAFKKACAERQRAVKHIEGYFLPTGVNF